MTCRVTIYSDTWGTHYVDVNKPSTIEGEMYVREIIRDNARIETITGITLYIMLDEIDRIEANMIF